MSTKTKSKTTKAKAKKENLEALPLPELWARFKEATGESRGAIGAYLTQLGACDAAALFAKEGATGT